MASTVYGILAGYDGSDCSEQALSWAAREARSRGTVLTVCHAWAPAYPALAEGADVLEIARQGAEEVLAQGMRYARSIVRSGDVRPLLVDGPVAGALCGKSADAAMVVLGSRGRGGLAGLLLGSVSSQVAAHACGRVVVVRGHWRPAAGYQPGPIVVGSDGSAGSQAAVAFAFEEAALREARLLAVCALSDTAGSLGGARRLEEDFEQVIARWEKEYPEVTVDRHVSDGPARPALLAAAHRAQMLVVGSRGRGGVRGMMLGSVSQALLHHAPCPVSVVHPAAGGPSSLMS
ncbi:MAG: universal stress protein [Micromonosporaceae bacterium]